MTRKKTVLVTGANRGLGLEISRQLGSKGMSIWVGCRSEKAAKQTISTLRAMGISVQGVLVDIREKEACFEAVQTIVKEDGHLDVLVNNAGIYLDKGVSALKTSQSDLQATFDVNVLGQIWCCQAAIPFMQRQGYGRIVNMSSMMGQLNREPADDSMAYRMSKAALNMVTCCMAAAADHPNIKVNAMSPGWVRTDMGSKEAPLSLEEGADTATWLATLDADGPTGGFFQDRKVFAW